MHDRILSGSSQRHAAALRAPPSRSRFGAWHPELKPLMCFLQPLTTSRSLSRPSIHVSRCSQRCFVELLWPLQVSRTCNTSRTPSGQFNCCPLTYVLLILQPRNESRVPSTPSSIHPACYLPPSKLKLAPSTQLLPTYVNKLAAYIRSFVLVAAASFKTVNVAPRPFTYPSQLSPGDPLPALQLLPASCHALGTPTLVLVLVPDPPGHT